MKFDPAFIRLKDGALVNVRDVVKFDLVIDGEIQVVLREGEGMTAYYAPDPNGRVWKDLQKFALGE